MVTNKLSSAEECIAGIDRKRTHHPFTGDDEDDGEEEDVYEDDERRSYDPEIATEERLGWVEDIRGLGLNRDR